MTDFVLTDPPTYTCTYKISQRMSDVLWFGQCSIWELPVHSWDLDSDSVQICRAVT